MIRVVLDTNLIISAYLNQDGLPFFILKLGLTGVVRMQASEAILTEYEEILRRKSYPLDRRRATLLLQKISDAARIVTPSMRLSVALDPDDNMFLECAQASKAHCLVTGNIAHFPPRLKSTQILTPRAFIEIWKDLYQGKPQPHLRTTPRHR